MNEDFRNLKRAMSPTMPQPVVPQHEELHAVEGEFVGWLSEAYPELFEEFNEINEGKRNGNEPKYKLVR